MEYFMIENGQQTGPFTINQLAQKHITSETLVWAEGMSNWTPAWQVEQLRYIITGNHQQTPPPYSPENQSQVFSDSGTEQETAQNSADDSTTTTGNNSENTNGEMGSASVPPTDTQDEHLNSDGGKKKKHTPGKIALVVIIVALLFFIFTNPNKQDHENAIKSEITTAIEKASNDNPNEQSDDIFTQGFNMITRMITGTFFDTVMNSMLQYHNYIFFSKTTVNLDGRSHTVSFGILGKVHTFNEDDILKVLDKTNPNQINIHSQYSNQMPHNTADQQNDQTSAQDDNDNSDQSANQAVSQITTQIGNKVQKKVEHKIEKEVDQATDSTTMNRFVNRIMNLFGIN